MSTKDDGIITLYMLGWEDCGEIELCTEKGLIRTGPIYISDKPNPRKLLEEGTWWHIVLKIHPITKTVGVQLTKDFVNYPTSWAFYF